MANKDNKSMRLNFYMKTALVSQIDEYAESLGITRSAAISVLCSNQLQSINFAGAFGNLSDAIKNHPEFNHTNS